MTEQNQRTYINSYINSQTAAVLFSSLGCLAISFYLRTINLSENSYWIDEMSSIHFAGHNYWGALLWDNSPPLYHLLLKFWIYLFGTSETATRSLSVLFSVTTTAIWMRAGYQRGGIIGLMWCGLIHSVLGLSITHARETRMYALLELTTSVFYLHILNIYEGKRVRLAPFVASTLALLFSHFLAILPIGMGLTAILARYRKKEEIRPYVIAMFAVFAIGLCCLPFISWPSLSWQELKFSYEQQSRWPWVVIGQTLGKNIGITTFGLLALAQLISRNRAGTLGAVGFITCFVLATLAGFAMSRAVFLQRYFIHILPLVMMVVLGAHQIVVENKNKFLRVSLTLLLAIFLYAHTNRAPNVISWQNPPWDQAAALIASTEQPIVFTTRPLSLRAPYFDNFKIDVVKLNVLGEDAFLNLLQATWEGKTTWILENSWGYHFYESQLNQFFITHGCSNEPRQMRKGLNDIIIAMKITCPLFKPMTDQ
jgi:uncharacterized membrane protein